MTFDITVVGVEVQLFLGITVSKSHGNIMCWDVVTIFWNWNQKANDPRWPLTPQLLRSHVQLHLRIDVSKSYENTLKYVDTIITSWKFNQNVTHAPLCT